MTGTKKIAILGSTGSIGTQALDIIRRHPDRFRVEALAAGRNLDLLLRQIEEFSPRWVSVREEADARGLKARLNGRVTLKSGEDGVEDLAANCDADLVLSGIVGAAGLRPTLAALRAKKSVALANKESLVIAGELMTREAERAGVRILPVDSEHSAIFQSLSAGSPGEVRRIILTASGGPFLGRSWDSLADVTVEEALNHPNWKMGSKITIDSATLMNKGLEVIEARWLFGFSTKQIGVCVHPQSIVHSMVEFVDGSVIAQMGVPDMHCAISYSLAYPERIESGVRSLSLAEVGTLSFFEPDAKSFPSLDLARRAAEAGGSAPAVHNAANEVVVERFLRHELGFRDIPRLVGETLERHSPRTVSSLEDVLEADRWGRETAARL